MNPRKSLLLGNCVLLCIARISFADKDEKCTKLQDRPDPPMTTLRKQILCNYDRHTAPVNASLGNRVHITTYLYDYRVEYESSLKVTPYQVHTTMFGASPNWFSMYTYVVLSWKDPRLKWYKNDHNNRTRIHFGFSEIWTPDVDVLSSFSILFGEDDGTVRYGHWALLVGNCWPIYFHWGDQRECLLSFRVRPDDKVQLARAEETFESDHHRSKSATWSVVKAKRIYPLKKGEKNDTLVEINKQRIWKYGPGYFESSVTIQRNFAVQDAVIFAPAAVLAILLISSTWIPAMHQSRMGMLSTVVVAQVFMFHQASQTMPFLPAKLVDIVDLYHDLIMCSGAAILEWLIAFIIATQNSPCTESTSAVSRPSLFTTLKTIFFIPEKDSTKIEISLLLDRITFLVLAIICFILVVVLAKRPPSIPFDPDMYHDDI